MIRKIILLLLIMMPTTFNLSEMYGRGPCKAESPWGRIRVQRLTIFIIRVIMMLTVKMVIMMIMMRRRMLIVMITCHPLLLKRVNPLRLPPLAILAATFPKPSSRIIRIVRKICDSKSRISLSIRKRKDRYRPRSYNDMLSSSNGKH